MAPQPPTAAAHPRPHRGGGDDGDDGGGGGAIGSIIAVLAALACAAGFLYYRRGHSAGGVSSRAQKSENDVEMLPSAAKGAEEARKQAQKEAGDARKQAETTYAHLKNDLKEKISSVKKDIEIADASNNYSALAGLKEHSDQLTEMYKKVKALKPKASDGEKHHRSLLHQLEELSLATPNPPHGTTDNSSSAGQMELAVQLHASLNSSTTAATPSSALSSSESCGGPISNPTSLNPTPGLGGMRVANVQSPQPPTGRQMIGRYVVTDVGKRVSSGKSYVVDGWHELTDDPVKVKVTKDSGDFQREKRALTTIKSERVVKMIDCAENFDGEGSHAIMLEAGMGNMAESINAMNHSGFDDMNKKAMCVMDAVLALQSIHHKYFVWTDLKSENFVNFMHPVLCKFTIKAVDFDSAVPQGSKIFGYTPKCMPPELARTIKNNGSFDDFTANPKYDMWSLGMLIWFVFEGKEFFDVFYILDAATGRVEFDEQQVITYLAAPDLEQKLRLRLDTLSHNPKLQSVLEKLLHVDPNGRPTCEDILRQSLFNSTADSTKAIGDSRRILSDLQDSSQSHNDRLSAIESRMADMNAGCKASCTDLQSVQAYIDSRIDEVKAFMGEVVQKLPTPTFVTSEKGRGFGFGKKLIKLWFVCPQTGSTCCTETKEWQKWAKVGFGAVQAGFTAFRIVTQGDVEAMVEGMGSAAKMLQMAHETLTDDPITVVESIVDFYSSSKSKSEANFDLFISEPFLTSSEHDALVEQLHAADFYRKMGYDAQTATWVQQAWLQAQSKPSPPVPLFSQGESHLASSTRWTRCDGGPAARWTRQHQHSGATKCTDPLDIAKAFRSGVRMQI
jgi:serine/threonine protein kinase